MTRRNWGLAALIAAFAFSALIVTGSSRAQDKAPAKAGEKAAGKTDEKAGEKKGPAAEAKVKIIVNDDETTWLKANDKETTSRGNERIFKSPPIEAGAKLKYSFEALIEPNNYTKIKRTHVVEVEGGKEYTVDLTKEDKRWKDDIQVRYVPTPMEAVRAMLKMAKVGKDDVVYDLGCGDGRLVSYAIKEFGAKSGYGVDIDPERVDDSNVLAKKLGVQDKVKFEVKDVQKITDVSDASVVLLYMGDDLNLVMRPTLQKTLKPGSRIVSHRFLMGDWMPDRTEHIDTEEGPIDIHLWTITGKESKK